MYQLIAFLRRISAFLLFILLEWIAVLVYAQSDIHTQSQIIGFTTNITGWFDTLGGDVENYLSLRQKNEDLLLRVAQLERQVDAERRENLALTLDRDSFVGVDSLEYIAAHVMSSSINKRHNYMTINKGMVDGIRENMAVVTYQGEMVGVVVGCSDRYSIVMSVLNTKFRSSGKISGKDHSGAISWDGKSRYQIQMNDLSKYAAVAEGDMVVTSGHSQIFPDGVTIGEVSSINKDNNNSFQLEIELAADLSALDNIFVISSNTLIEGRSVMEDFTDDGELSGVGSTLLEGDESMEEYYQ